MCVCVVCFALSLLLDLITVTYMSIYSHKSHLHQSKPYSNIVSVTNNIITISLSVSANTQLRSAPLRMFFLCWLCYCVAISTVFQAYLKTSLIKPGYEEPIKLVDQMLKSEINFGFDNVYKFLIANTSDPVVLAILKGVLDCPDEATSFIWTAVYRNIATVLNDFEVEDHRVKGNWTDENNRPLLCEQELGVVRTFEVGIFVQIKKCVLMK